MRSKAERKSFVCHDISSTLRRMTERGFRPLFFAEAMKIRTDAEKNSQYWGDDVLSVSLRATGKTSGGNGVDLYVHSPHYFLDPDHIDDVIEGMKLKDGIAILPNEEFIRLLKLGENGEGVIIVDHDKLKTPYGLRVSVDSALEIPATLAYFGGDVDVAKGYFDKYKLYMNTIGIEWNTGDLRYGVPVGRFLYFDNALCGLRVYDIEDMGHLGLFIGERFRKYDPSFDYLTYDY